MAESPPVSYTPSGMGNDAASDGIEPHALANIDQEVVVTFRYPVRFTRGIFDRRNTTLRDVVQAEGCARLLFVIDKGVADAHPTMVEDVQRYCAAFPDTLELPAPPLVVPGGEAIKNHAGPVDETTPAAAQKNQRELRNQLTRSEDCFDRVDFALFRRHALACPARCTGPARW